MKWIDALKVWNEQHNGTWCVPKKGTPGYNQVIAIMNAGAPTAKAAADCQCDDTATKTPSSGSKGTERYRTLRGKQGSTRLIFY
jgi:hypothetical protein